ncbi:MAG: F0F1 ATP synthase subunit delta [Croceibacterium sp.]
MTIDWWTLGFQTVNVGILIWLLSHFFWKPVAAMIAERKAAVQKLTDEATAAKAKTDEVLAEVEKTRAGFVTEREAILAAAQKEAETARAASLVQAKSDADALQAAAQTAIDKAKTEQERAWADRSSDLAVTIAERLAARLDGAAVEACFLGWLVEELRKLPKADREVAGGDATKLEATTATKIAGPARKDIVASISKALGGAPQISFKTDPALIAGIELRGDHLIVASSWRADLATIAASLKAAPTA